MLRSPLTPYKRLNQPSVRQWPHSCAVHMQATCVRLLVERETAGNTGRVFCHQPQDRPAGKGFLLGLTSPFMLRQATVYGHRRAVLVDATHAMNSYNVRLLQHDPLQLQAFEGGTTATDDAYVCQSTSTAVLTSRL